jgi:hypothetical protein
VAYRMRWMYKTTPELHGGELTSVSRLSRSSFAHIVHSFGDCCISRRWSLLDHLILLKSAGFPADVAVTKGKLRSVA